MNTASCCCLSWEFISNNRVSWWNAHCRQGSFEIEPVAQLDGSNRFVAWWYDDTDAPVQDHKRILHEKIFDTLDEAMNACEDFVTAYLHS